MVALHSEADALQRGDEAPDFELEATDGETYSLADFEDREALLVVFTCNHCPYAQAKYEAMNTIADEFDEVAVVGINPNDAEEYPEDSFEKMVEYVERGEIDVAAYLRDESQAVAEAYGAVCTPDSFLFENDREALRASERASSAEQSRSRDGVAVSRDDEDGQRPSSNHSADSRVARDSESPSDHASGPSAREQTAEPRDDGDEPRATFRLAYHGRLDDAQTPEDEPSGPPGFEMLATIEDVLGGEEPSDDFRPSRGCSIKWRE